MDDPLRLIRHLYDEDEDASTLERRLSEDEVLYREYERLQNTKKRLDERPSRRPDPAVVDQVVETARAAAQRSPSTPHSDRDRAARSPARSWDRRLQTAGASLALLLLIGLGWWQSPGASEETATMSAAGSPQETVEQDAPAVTDERTAGTDAVPAWDDRDELVRIHRRIERLQAHSAPGQWGSLQQVDQHRP